MSPVGTVYRDWRAWTLAVHPEDRERVVTAMDGTEQDDFEIALLMGRVAAATHDADLARSYFAQARRLAGERWTRSLADEEARLAGGPAHDPASRAVAGG